MDELRYERPHDIKGVLALAGQDGVRMLAGGTDLVPQLREGRRKARVIIDLKHVPALTSIERRADSSWRIGAAATVGAMGRHDGLAREHAALLEAARLIGSLQVQNRASLGGNLCNAAPSADAVPLLIALGAMAEIMGPSGSRTVPAASVPEAPGRTSLATGEIVAALIVPAQPARSAARYLRFTPRREMDIAIAGSGVRLGLGADGRISSAAVVLASVAPVPLIAERAGEMLIGAAPSTALFAAAGAKAAEEARPISDTRGSAAYRRELVSVLTRRALADCAERLGVVLS